MMGLYVLQVLYLFLRLWWPKGADFCFHLIKEQVFSIEGACKSTGNCCRSIMLYDKGVPLGHISDFTKFSDSYPEYKIFQANHRQGHIHSFSCQALTKENKCNQYLKRPVLCRQYPKSFFYTQGYIYDSCGYQVVINEKKYGKLSPRVKKIMDEFYIKR